MKNSPDSKWLDDLKKRLGEYAEEPDADLWNKIVAAANKRPDAAWITPMNRAAMAAALLLLLWPLTDFLRRSQPVSGPSSLTIGQRAPVERSTPASEPFDRLSLPDEDVSGNTITLKKSDTDVSPFPGHLSKRKEVPYEVTVAEPDQKPVDGRLLQEVSDSVVTVPTATDPAVESTRKNEVVLPRKKRVLLYGSVSPSLAFQRIFPFQNDGIGIESFHSKPIFSADRLGFALHSGVQTRLNARLEAYSGLLLYRQSQRLVYDHYSDQISVDQDVAFEYRVSPGTIRKSVNYNMMNVGVEAGLMYHLAGDRLLHKLGAGLSWQHGTKKAKESDTYANSDSHYLFYQLFYRNEYALNNRFNLYIQPFYRHVLLSREAPSEPFRIRPYHAGLSLGIVYR